MRGQGMTISDQVGRHAAKIGSAPALAFGPHTRTYAELDKRVGRLAAALAARGVQRGERIAILALNGIEYVETMLAAARLGAITVPLNFRFVADEAAYVLADSGAVALVVDAALAQLAAAARSRNPVATCLVFGGDADDAGPGAESYEDALAAAEPVDPPDIADDDAALIMYTSGTTGRPKGAVLTHRNLFMHAASYIAHLGITPDNRTWLAGSPMFHIAGVSSMLTYLLLGGRTVITPSGQFDAAESVRLMAREQVSACFFVPAQWQLICALPHLGEHDLSALRRIIWGAAPASTTLIRQMIDCFPQAEVVTVFGQTECSPVTTVLLGDDALRKVGSVGTAMLNVEVRVVDELMRDVPVGEVGEAVYRGPTVMREYWNKLEATAEAFAGGWFHSGDLVRSDEDGYLWVVDRKKDMIISGGENIYCAEVEDVLAGHPGIVEVALIGVPDEKWGETPLAVVVARYPEDPPTLDAISDWCRDRLSAYKRPRRLVVLDALPRNPGGKVVKRDLRSTYAAPAGPDAS
jgi:fatty-acyl-CoA synthase